MPFEAREPAVFEGWVGDPVGSAAPVACESAELLPVVAERDGTFLAGRDDDAAPADDSVPAEDADESLPAPLPSSARATPRPIPWPLPIATPTPSATANAPMRPTNIA